jgi:hypothetical protein
MPYYVHFHRATLEAELRGDRTCTLAAACMAPDVASACAIFDRPDDPRRVAVRGRSRATLPGDLVVEVAAVDELPIPYAILPLGLRRGRRMTDFASATMARYFLDADGWRVKLAALAETARRGPTPPGPASAGTAAPKA